MVNYIYTAKTVSKGTMCFWFKDGRKVFKRGSGYILFDPSLEEGQYRRVDLSEMRQLEKEVQDECPTKIIT